MNEYIVPFYLKLALTYINEKKIALSFLSTVILFITPIKPLKIGMIDFFIHLIKDIIGFGILLSITCYLLISIMDYKFLKTKFGCIPKLSFFKWLVSFWKGYYINCTNTSTRLDESIQEIIWISLLMKSIHIIEILKDKFLKNTDIINLSTYVFYILLYSLFIFKSFIQTRPIYNSTEQQIISYAIEIFIYSSRYFMIIYTIISLAYCCIDLLFSIAKKKKTYSDEDESKITSFLLFTKDKYGKKVPYMRCMYITNLFIFVSIFFKKYFDIEIK
jgi:hypothetical protein